MIDRPKIFAKSSEVMKKNAVSQTKKSDFANSIKSPVDYILFLQRTIGNQAVQSLFKSGAIQAKLGIREPGDIYEQEADIVALQVMPMPESQVQRQPEEEKKEMLPQLKPLAGYFTPLVQRQVKEEAAGTPKTGKGEYCLDYPWAKAKGILNSNFQKAARMFKNLNSRVEALEKS